MTWPVNWCKIWGIEFYRTIGFLCNFTEKEKIIYLKRVGTEHTCNPPIMRSKKKGRIAKRSTRFIGPIKNWNLRGEHANLICKIQRIRNLFISLTRWWIITRTYFNSNFYPILLLTVYSMRKKTTAILSIMSMANVTVG